MVRPHKDPASRKSVDLRIPVTEAQKQIVSEAMAKLDVEFAGWARTLILTTAEGVLSEREPKKSSKRARSSKP